MNQFSDLLSMIFTRLSQFLYVLDISFIISGSLTFGAFTFFYFQAGYSSPFYVEGWTRVVLLGGACYISGLISFSAGRWLRMGSKKALTFFEDLILDNIDTHGLSNTALVQRYISGTSERRVWRLYIRLWVEVRSRQDNLPSIELLNRYWTMSATFDGLFLSFCIWIFISLLLKFGFFEAISPTTCFLMITFFVPAAFFCFREAGRYHRYQVEELVAVFARQLDQAETSYPPEQVHLVQTNSILLKF